MNLFLKIAKYGAYSFLLVFGILITRFFLFQIYIIDGNSMLPNLKHGDKVLVYKYHFPTSSDISDKVFEFGKMEIDKLDILLFEAPDGSLLLKRLIGVPGDFYSFKNGSIFIDNLPIKEYYIIGDFTSPPNLQTFKSKETYYPMDPEGRIPPGYYLLLGDNRKISYDSRSFGLVPEEALRGKVIHIF